MGTGSGIVTIGASLLGVRRATAIDHDPLAVGVARANIRRNRVRGVRLLERSLERWREHRRYDCVVANLDTALVLKWRERLIGWVRRGGILCVTGIGVERGEAVASAYEREGLELIGRFRDRAWCGFCFRKLRSGVRRTGKRENRIAS